MGSALVRQFLRNCMRLLALGALPGAVSRRNLPETAHSPDHRPIMADITNRDAVVAATSRACQPAMVFDMAAETHLERSIGGASVIAKTKVTGAFTMRKAALGHAANLPDPDRFRFVRIPTDRVEFSNIDRGPSGCLPLDATRAPADGAPVGKEIVLAEDRTRGDNRYTTHPCKPRRDSGWRLLKSIDEGLSETIEGCYSKSWNGCAPKRLRVGLAGIGRD